AFDSVFIEHPDSAILQAWQARLHYMPPAPVKTEKEPLSLHTEIPPGLLVTLLALLAGFLINLPNFFPWRPYASASYYFKFAAFFYLPWIACYFMALNSRVSR